MKIRLGYMGIPFSNSEAMAMDFAKEMNWSDVEYVPLMSSKDTVDALLRKEIDYGVVATRNITAGTVIETQKALEGKPVKIVKEGSQHIHHCAFSKNKNCKIDQFCSHIQALGQCKETLDRMYPGSERIECSDTAYAAEMLSKNMLPDNCAALCKKSAGEFYGLYLLHENIEDRKDNETFFALLSL